MKICFQEKKSLPLAWAFQKESELAPLFNYYLDMMQQTGVIDRLEKKFVGKSDKSNIETQVQDINSLGFEKVVFPFLALVTGLSVAFMQLGFETVIMCKNKFRKSEDD